MKFLRFFIFPCALFFCSFSLLFSQNDSVEKTIIEYSLETLGSFAYQSTTPFWMHNNSRGIIPLESNHALLRGNISGIKHLNRKFRIEAGLDIIGKSKGMVDSLGSHSGVSLQQLYVTMGFRALTLTIGARENYHSMLDKQLSSGDLSFSANARPIPEVNLQIPDFIPLPYTKNYVWFKGDFAVGKFIDDAYIRGIVRNSVYTRDVLLHHKSFFLSIREPSGRFPLQLILGVEDCAQWGGWNSKTGNLPRSFQDFLRIITGASGGEDAPEGEQINRLGNHLGTYFFRLGYNLGLAELAVYKQHYFEDNSGMEYANWRDGIWGVECRFFKQSFLKKIVVEYIQTTNQSGPFHFPFLPHYPPDLKIRIGGGESYYNHGYYKSGWSHFGQAVGNPLVTSPEYNKDGSLGFKNTRIKALHGGITGNLFRDFSYRMLGTAMYGYGTMPRPFLKRKYGLSGLLECNYTYPKGKGWELGIQVAVDKGSLYGNNIGCLLKMVKKGIL